MDCVRKRVIGGSLLLLLLLTLSVLGYRHMVPSIIPLHASIIFNQSLAEMEDGADYIVIATPTGEARQEVKVNEAGGKSYNTFTTIEVQQVFKGQIQPGQTLEVAEPIGYERRTDGLYLITLDNYLPLCSQQSYLLFLKNQQNRWLRISAVWQGKFVWPIPQIKSAETLEVNYMHDSYLKLAEEVARKYDFLTEKE